MRITVDAEATLQIVSKTDEALADLDANFEACDNATTALAAMLANGAHGVSQSVQHLAAREGGHRTEPFAQAHTAGPSLRDAVGDFVRFGEHAVDELEALRDSIELGIKEGIATVVGGIVTVERIGKEAVANVIDFGEDVVHNAQDFGEDVVHNAEDFGEDVADTAHDIAETLSDLSKRRGIFDL